MALIGQTQTLTANGSSTPIDVPAGKVVLAAGGTWGGATVTPKISLDGGTLWVPLKKDPSSLTVDATFTSDGSFEANLPQCKLRFDIANVTTTSVKVQAASSANSLQ